ncbi:MAG: substrate-binding domain-containing protein [Clostridia bacterium]|nr:substrate-binding domain-containing protein [Clostridia bacterium]
MKKWLAVLAVIAMLAASASAEGITTLPQIDNSTARIPITDAIYALFTGRGAEGPAPICSKTHGAWLNLASGKADIIFLIAPTQDELDAFREAGVDIEMKVYGYDGLVFLGNASNPVTSLTPSEIRGIYRGDITGWSQVGEWKGQSGEIEVYIRNPESGSQRLFEKLVWTGYEMPDFSSMGYLEQEVGVAQAHRDMVYDMEGALVEAMVNRYSIGFNIMSYVDDKILGSGTIYQTVTTTGTVNLRSWAGLDADVLGKVPKGTKLRYMESSEIDDRGVVWYLVAVGDPGEDGEQDTAWVSSKYANLDLDKTSLKVFDINGYPPTSENFANGNYPFVTTSYVAIRADEPEDSPARLLYNWVGTDESREIIGQNSTLSVDFTDSVVLCQREDDFTAEGPLARLAADLDAREIGRSELYGLTEAELHRLYLSVFAHTGKRFFRDGVQAFFDAQPWYQKGENANCATAEQEMNDIEHQNLSLIGGYLSEYRVASAATQPRVLAYDYNEEEMTGNDVRQLQKALEAWGYNDRMEKWEDGAMNWALEMDLECCQEENGLEATGILDPVTRMMLMEE